MDFNVQCIQHQISSISNQFNAKLMMKYKNLSNNKIKWVFVFYKNFLTKNKNKNQWKTWNQINEWTNEREWKNKTTNERLKTKIWWW